MGKRVDLANHTLTFHRKEDEIQRRKHLQSICRELGAREDDRFFCMPSGEHAIEELLLAVYLDVVRETGRTHFITPRGTHKRLEKLGCAVKAASLNSRGQITPEALDELIRARTALVSLDWADPLTGVIQPLEDLIRVCKKKEVLVHVDASSVIGKLFFRFQDLDLDFFTFHSSSGGLLIRGGRSLNSLFHGGEAKSSQVEALATVLQKTAQNFEYLCTEIARLRDKLERGILDRCEAARILFSDVERLPNVSAISFPGISGELLLFHLQRRGIEASSGDGALPGVLMRTGIEPLTAHSVISFALSPETTEEEIDRAIDCIAEVTLSLKPLGACLC